MIRIAILGGTRFFGKSLVKKLLRTGAYNVDVYSRSNSKFKIDRGNKEDLEKVFRKKYDVIIDNICFGSSDAKIVNEIFENNKELLPKQYIFTSTSFVYKELENTNIYNESIKFVFDEITNKKYPDIDYALGKKESEYAFTNGILSDVLLIIRPPYMIGNNDHTGRLHKMIELVKNNSHILINKNDLQAMSFIDVELLSDILIQFINESKFGVYNVSNSSCISNKEIYQLIGHIINKKTNFINKKNNELLHPYSLNKSLCLDISKLKNVYNNMLPSVEQSLTWIIRDHYEKN